MTAADITTKSLIQNLKGISDDVVEKMIGYDIIPYTLFFVDIVNINKINEIECKDVDDITHFLKPSDLSVKLKLRLLNKMTWEINNNC